MALTDLLNGLGGNQKGLAQAALEMFGSQQGGLQGLAQLFQSKGLGDVVNSWISTGQNLPISVDQLRSVLGNDMLQNLASKSGLDVNGAVSQLANLLPQLVDQLTPNGSIEGNDLLEKGMGMLKGLFR